MTKKQKKVLIRIIIAAVLVIALQFIPVKGYVRFGLYMIPYFVIGYDILKKAGKGILNRQIFDENFLMAVATSIDALAVGVTFAFLEVKILPAISMIGITTFCLSLVGVAVGNFFGTRYKKRAEATGGIILVLLGIKILLEHLGFLG